MIRNRPREQFGDEQGFSLIELMIVVVIISIVAALVQPKMHGVILKARATDVVGDLNVVKVATHNFQADNSSWPAEASVGVIPTGLADYLPDDFSFAGENYTLDFDNNGGIPFSVGVTMVTTDSDLGLAVLDILGKGMTNTGTKYSWIID